MHKKMAQRNAQVYMKKRQKNKKEAAQWLRQHIRGMNREDVDQIKEHIHMM